MEEALYIRGRIEQVREDAARAAARGGYPPPTLVAVTKKMTDDQLFATLPYVEDVAENYPSRFALRYDLLREKGVCPRMHLIGALQTNKVKLVVGKACLIHSVDSIRLADAIDKESRKRGVVSSVLVEVNSGREPNKGGVLPEDAAALCAYVATLRGVRLRGLMTMGPKVEEPEQLRPYFRLTRRLFDQLREAGMFATPSPILSMGMSDSYAVAAEEGSTMIRVGQALYHPQL